MNQLLSKMKNMKWILALLFIFELNSNFAQIDTSFWFAAPWVTPDHHWKDNYILHISTLSAPTTTVRVRQPAALAPNRYDTTIVIGPNQTFNYILWRDKIANATNFAFDSLEARPANTVLPYGLYISATSSITVVYDVATRAPNFLNTETFSMKGQNGLGTEFVTPFQTFYRNRTLTGDLNSDGVVTQPKQMFCIIASQPNTTVWITPKCNIVGHAANVTYSIVLNNAGDVYTCENTVQNTYVAGNNLSGSIVVSDKPIAVTVSDDSANNPLSAIAGYNTPPMGCFDLMGDQIVPVDVIGKDYILNLGQLYKLNPGTNSPGMKEAAYIVATDNFTQLTIKDGATITNTVLNKGDTYMDSLKQPLTYVNATKNVYVIHASGYGCELGEAILPPLNCAGSRTVAFSRNSAQKFSVNILVDSSYTKDFKIDGLGGIITASNFTLVPGTKSLVIGGYYGSQVNFNTVGPLAVGSIPIGPHVVTNDSADFALGVFDGDNSSGGLFHYMSSFKRRVYTKAANDFTVCQGATGIPITGTITGGAITGIWEANGIPISSSAYTSTLTNVNANYTISPTATGTIKFKLTSIGTCENVSDSMYVYIQPAAAVIASPTVVTRCKNNLTPVTLNGTVTNAPGGQNWSGGSGTYGATGSANTSYTPSVADATTGTVSLVLFSLGGCSNSTDTVKVNFTDPPTVSVPPDMNVCTNNSTVAINSGTISGGTTQGVWSTNGQGYFSPSDTIMSTGYVLGGTELTAGGTVTIALTSVNNGLCAAVTKTLAINIFPKPVVNAGLNDTICASAGVINLNGLATFAGAPTTPTWSAISGTGSFGSVNSATTTYAMSANDTISGFVQFEISAQGVCPNPEKDTISISILKLPFVNAGSNSLVCDNVSIALNGTVTGFTGTGQWASSGTGTFVPNNTSLNNNYSPSLSDIAGGSVTFTLASTNNKGCNPVRDSVRISFKPSPSANFVTGNTCVNDPVKFTDASSGGIVSQNWDFGDGATSITNNPIHSYTLGNTYTVTYVVTSANGCPDTIRKPITINSLPVPDFYFNNACQSLQTLFKDTSFVNPGSIVKWSWDFKDGTTDTTTKSPTHVYTSAGLYNVVLTVTSDKGCVSTTTKPVNVLPQPQAEFGMTNNPTLALENVYFSDFSTPSGSIANWFWNFGDSVTAIGSSPVHFFADQGTYVVTLVVVDDNGCSDTTRKDINVTLLPLVPTAFSPNKDGNNDLLFVKGGPFENMKFRVYNNWGEMVFETTDQKTGWDGTFRGLDAPIGVYVWVLEVDMYNNKSVKKSGDVTLLR
jgi:gliding motility-associated-like protein